MWSIVEGCVRRSLDRTWGEIANRATGSLLLSGVSNAFLHGDDLGLELCSVCIQGVSVAGVIILFSAGLSDKI